MSKLTLVSTNARIDALTALIAEQQEALALLQTELQAAQVQLDQQPAPQQELVIWVNDKFAKTFATKNGEAFTFTGRTGDIDEATGKRTYGDYMTFKVWDADLVATCKEMMAGSNRLVALTAEARDRDYNGKTYTDYHVSDLRVIARPQVAPALDEIAF